METDCREKGNNFDRETIIPDDGVLMSIKTEPEVVVEQYEKSAYKISTNISKKEKSKKKLWSSQEESILCELWASKIDKLREVRKNSYILEEMRLELEDMGAIVVSVEEIRSKLHNLTTKYRKEKKKVGTTGGSPSLWRMYSKVHNILGSHKKRNLKNVVEESIPENSDTLDSAVYTNLENPLSDSQSMDDDDLPSTSHSYNDVPSSSPVETSAPRKTAKKRTRRDHLLQKILTKIESIEEREKKGRTDQMKWAEKIYNLEVEKKQILEKISNDNDEIKKELLNLLKK